MRSSRFLLDNRYERAKVKAGNADRLGQLRDMQLRLLKLQDLTLEEDDLPAIEPPDLYTDRIHFTTMTYPVNIGLTAATPFYVDRLTLAELNNHPLSRAPLNHRKFAVDTGLEQRIEAFVTIEEIRIHLEILETRRLETIYPLLEGKSDKEVSFMLARHAKDMLKILRYPKHQIPKEFFSSCPNIDSEVMSVPVVLDKEKKLDFFQLLAFNDQLRKEELRKSQKAADAKLIEAKRLRRQEHEREYEWRLAKIKEVDLNHSDFTSFLKHKLFRHDLFQGDSMTYKPHVLRNQATLDYLRRRLSAYIESRIKKLNAIKASVEERIDEMFIEIDTCEYMHPATGQPVSSINIDYQLLKELDKFLANAMLEKQLIDVRRYQRRFDANIKLIDKDYPGKSFEQILKQIRYPQDKIPESLKTGLSISGRASKIMTHPVILDGQYSVDFLDLLRYWQPRSSWFGWSQDNSFYGKNPFTGKPVKTITYDAELRRASEMFIANADYFKQSIREADIEDPDFIRKRFQKDDRSPEEEPRRRGVLYFNAYSVVSRRRLGISGLLNFHEENQDKEEASEEDNSVVIDGGLNEEAKDRLSSGKPTYHHH